MIHPTRKTRCSYRAYSLELLIRLALVIVAVACSAGASSLQASDEQLPKAEIILDKYVEVTGGKAAYEKITNRVTKATFEMMGMGIKADLTIYHAKPDKMYTLMESEALGKIEKGTNGEVVWEISMMMGPQIKEGQERIDALREAIFDKEVYWRKVYKQAECVGIETIDDKPCYKVVLTPNEGHPLTCYYDQKSNLEVKVELTFENPMGTFPIEVYVSDYKEVDGILIPHNARVKVMGQERMVTTQSIEHNVDLPSDRFKLPAEIQALLDKEKNKKEQDKKEQEPPSSQPSDI